MISGRCVAAVSARHALAQRIEDTVATAYQQTTVSGDYIGNGMSKTAVGRFESGRGFLWPTRTLYIGVPKGGAQVGAVQFSAAALADAVPGRLRGAAYDPTSSYFECNPPEAGKRRFGHSRDHIQTPAGGDRPDRDPEGFPLALRGDAGQRQRTAPMLYDFLQRISVRQGPPHLGDGPRHPDGRSAGGDGPHRRPLTFLLRYSRGVGAQLLEKDFLIKPWPRVRDAAAAEAHRRMANSTFCPC